MTRVRSAVRACLRTALVLSVAASAVTAQGGADATTETHPDVLERIAFGSCAFEYRPQPIWRAIREQDPQLWVWGGDNIYIDIDGPDEPKYRDETATADGFIARTRRKYAALAAIPGYQEFLTGEPFTLATWDDHDYGLNDAGVEFPYKRQAQDLFHDFHGTAKDSPRRDREGVYHSAVYGPIGKRVQVIVLDTRTHRSELSRFRSETRRGRGYRPLRQRGTTMLGTAQWDWLESRLREPADLRVIVSSIQFVSEEHPYEKWGNLPNERSKMLRLIDETKAKGVVFVSGDRHHGELSMLHRDGDYPIYDLTASGLTQSRPRKNYGIPEANIHRVGRVVNGPHFGTLEIDWSQPDPRLTMRVLMSTAETPIEHVVTLGELGRDVVPRSDDLVPAEGVTKELSDPEVSRWPLRIDGDASDWERLSSESFAGDSWNYFARFRTDRIRSLAQDDESLRISFDLDGRDGTGAEVFGLAGTDVSFEFAPDSGRGRNPYRYVPRIFRYDAGGDRTELKPGDLNLQFQPSHASDLFEMRFARATFPHVEGLVCGEMRVSVRSKSDGAERVLAFDAAELLPRYDGYTGSAGLEQPSIEKAEGSIRVVSWNVLWAGPQSDEQRAKFSRVFKALKPDVILLQEWDQSRFSEEEVATWFRENVDSERNWSAMVTGTQGYGQGTAVVTWHPVTAKAPAYVPVESGRWRFPMRLAAAVIETPRGRVLAGSVHLKASGSLGSGEDGRRMAEAKAANMLMRGLSAGAQPDVIVLGGDLNMNGTTEVERLLFRDLDLDRSPLRRAEPSQLMDEGLAYTFGRSDSKARLDYLGYSDISAEVTKSFVFDTTLIFDEQLAKKWGIQPGDAHASDHLPVVLDLKPSVVRDR